IELIKNPVQSVQSDLFSSLQSGDILFIDSTHVSKIGSDVNHMVLKELPVLQKGVPIHFHDIFLPWEFPRVWVGEGNIFWNEQFLVAALLAHNRDFEIVFSSQFAGRACGDCLKSAFAVLPVPSEGGGSLWIRRKH